MFINKHSDKWIPEPNSGCYLWLGALSGGRPRVRHNGKHQYAVKVFCDEVKGPCPDELERSHVCQNGLCVNPDHVVYESHTFNELRKYSRPETPYIRKNGRRFELMAHKVCTGDYMSIEAASAARDTL